MKITSLFSFASAAALLLATAMTSTSAQAQAPAAPPAGSARAFTPTNLQVLPKDITGQQLHDTMETWAGSLGVHCDNCHEVGAPGPNGRPRMNFAGDGKDDKKIARLMYQMVQQINEGTIKKTAALDPDSAGMEVTCGTCHRGHKMPEKFEIPKGGAPAGAPPAGGMPGMAMPPAAH